MPYERVIAALAAQYASPFNPADELAQIGRIGVWQGMARYDPTTGASRATWAYHCARGAIRHYVRAHREPSTMRSLSPEEFVGADGDSVGRSLEEMVCGPRFEDRALDRLMLNRALAQVLPRQRALLLAIYRDQWTEKDVACATGRTPESIHAAKLWALEMVRAAMAAPRRRAGRAPMPHRPFGKPKTMIIEATPGARLTRCEMRVLRALREGATDAEIAAEMGTKPATIAFHMRNLQVKLGAHNRTHALVLALRAGIVALTEEGQ